MSILDEAEWRPSRRAKAAACVAAIEAESPVLLPPATICSGVISGDLDGGIGGVAEFGSCSRLVSVSIACVLEDLSIGAWFDEEPAAGMDKVGTPNRDVDLLVDSLRASSCCVAP